MATEESKPVPPEPLHMNPIQDDENVGGGGRAFNQAWARWFTALRTKINVINESIATLGEFTGVGIVVKNGAQWVARTITGNPTEITVTNGNGVSGNPNIGLADVPNLGTGALLAITRDGKGRVTGTKVATITGTAAQIVVTNGDAVAGVPTLSLASEITTAINTVVFPPMTLADANALVGVAYGQAVLITDVATGAEPCWYDTTIPSGTKWRKCTDRSIAT